MSSNAADNSFTALLYHFTSNNNGVPIFPYITAVTGHRNFAQPGQTEGIPGFSEDAIKEAFKSELQPMAEFWRNSCNGTAPFVLLTGMADGADQIAAEAAMELDSDLNIKVVAVLPMPEELYVNTIDDKDRFNRLMQKVSFTFNMPLTANNQGHESELANICEQTEHRRQEQYILLSRFLALHSHVLFAFWDGIPSTQLSGGTADTVFFKINGNTETQTQGDLLTFSSVGPVVHLLIPRNNQDNCNYPLDPNLDMSSIPVFYWTRDIIRHIEITLKKKLKKQQEKDASSQDNPDGNECESDSSLFNNSNSLVSIAKFNYRKELMTSDLRCKTAIANLPEIQVVLSKIGALNKYSVPQFRHTSFLERIFCCIFRRQTFFEKCKISYQWLFNLPDDADDKASKKVKDDVPFCNLFGKLLRYEDSNTRILVEHYIVADQMALKYQSYSGFISFLYSIVFAVLSCVIGFLATYWSIRIYNWAAKPESFYHFVWTCFGSPNHYSLWCLPKLSWFYIGLSAFLIIIYIIARRLKFHYRYHRFRAIAEALRIQIFWRIAGIGDCVSGFYRSHQILETEWIRAAVNGLDVFLSTPQDTDFEATPSERIQFAKDTWVLGQRDYFSKKTVEKNKEQKGFLAFFTHPYMLLFLAALFFCLPLKGDIIRLIYTPSPNQSNLSITIFVILGIIISIITGLVVFSTMRLKFKRAKAEAKRFEQILFPFDRAMLLLNIQRPDSVQQMILRQLGTEAVSENVNWLLTVGEQDLNLPR